MSFVSFAPPHLLGHEVRRLKEDTMTLYVSVRTLTRGMETRWTEIVTTRTGVDRTRAETAEARLLQIERDRIRDIEEIERLKTRVDSVELEITRRGAWEAYPTESIDVLAVYGDARHLEPQGPSNGSH
ncbi:hypothetical protein Tco_0760793 [Tanacetum coccineum]